MCRTSRDSLVGGGPDAQTQPRPSDEVVSARQGGDPAKCVADGDRSLRVLVADDDRDTVDTLSALVALWGHDVRVAYDGAAVLEMASAFQPDVLLLDVAMPKPDGCYLAQQLRREAPFQSILLVAITGYGDEAHRLLGEEAGFDHYLVKPVDPSTVERLLLRERRRLAGSRGAPRHAADVGPSGPR
jgi:two-component system, sensor histidine kinase